MKGCIAFTFAPKCILPPLPGLTSVTQLRIPDHAYLICTDR